MIVWILINKTSIWYSALLIVFLAGINMQATASEHCSASHYPFASCPRMIPSYKAVILAVHGWNGSCKNTFGEGEESIFEVLDDSQTHFYDFDCFEYDSHNTPILDNVRLLYARMKLLHELGYTHAMLITHSTGGVIALQMLTDTLLNDDNELRQNLSNEFLLASNGIQIPAVQAWATPINGLKSGARIAGKFVAFIGYSPETFPDLEPRSQFLNRLKERLKIIGKLSADIPDQSRTRISDVNVNFYHGQENDLIVLGINDERARKYGWLWPVGRGGLIDTGLGHTHNIAESGAVGSPRFTGHTMKLEALLELPFEPRYDEVFRSDLLEFPDTLVIRQKGIINALIFYAKYKFWAVISPAMSFFEHMITKPFSGLRSRDVDLNLVTNLSTMMKDRSASESLIQFQIAFVRRILMNYCPSGLEDLKIVGHNHSSVVSVMLDMAIFIHNKTLDYLKQQTEDRQADILIIYYPENATIDEFDREMQNVFEKFLGSGYHTVQNQTIAYLPDVVARSNAEVLNSSKLLESMAMFTENNHHVLPQKQKTQILQAIEAATSKSPTLRLAILERWGTEVAYQEQQRPLWATLNDDRIITKLVEQVSNNQRLHQTELEFLFSVIMEGGAKGNSVGVVRLAEQKLSKAVVEGRIYSGAGPQLVESLTSGDDVAAYPFIAREIEDQLSDLF